MDITISDSDLRRALDDIGVYPHEHFGIVEDIGYRTGCAHQIERVAPQPLQPGDGTCLPVALDLVQRADFSALVRRKRIFATGRFVRWLLEHGHLTQQPTVTDGSLVLYFSGNDWKHAGVGHGMDRVISKWGTWLVLRHPIDQVPSDYGRTIRAYQHPGSDRAMQLFQDFVVACDQLPLWARPT
jgi:hypothetical protein